MRIFLEKRKTIGNRAAARDLWCRHRQTVAYIFVVLVSVLAVALAFNTAGREASIACRQVNRIQSAVLAILVRQQQVLPSNPFFKIHPEALPNARIQVQDDINFIKGAACKP